jgi:predicted homoserine dehydrogenase-like protein
MVDVVSCVREDESFVPDHLRWGVYVTFTSESAYARRCFGEYGITTDPSGRYAALWRPYHLIGLEIGVSVASVALRGEPTGAPFAGHRAEVVCATRVPLARGATIDGEGGYAVYGMCVPAELARERRLIPMGLAHGLRMLRDVPADHPIGEDDVAFEESSFLWKLRREQDALFATVTA